MMSTKRKNLENSNSCLNKAAPDEPIFVLRAKDPVASMVVRIWASLSESMKTQPREKCGRAWQVAVAMEQWRADAEDKAAVMAQSFAEAARAEAARAEAARAEAARAPKPPGLWFLHTPGDVMPCPADQWVEVVTRKEQSSGEWASAASPASFWLWGAAREERMANNSEIIAWRPA
jgi:hypothetical protein